MADDQPELHELTRMLLLRLDTHPEEFFDNFGHPAPYKWRHALQSVEHYGRPEDKQALYAAYMDHALRAALKTLLAPEEANAAAVGQGPVRIPTTGNVSVVSGGNGGNGGSGGASMTGGPSLTQQQAQQVFKNLVSQAKEQQKPTVTISTSVAKAAGLKPMTAKEQIEHWKKRLGL